MFAPPRKVLTNPEAWGTDEYVLDALIKWADARNYVITHKRDLPTGRSGSRVAVAAIKEGTKKPRQVIVKLVPPELAMREAESIARAKVDSPKDFFLAHIVEVTENTPPPELGRWWVQEQKIAGIDLMKIETLGELIDHENFAAMCGEIVRSVAVDWRGDQSEEIEATPEGFLREYFASSPSPRREAGLREFAKAAQLSFAEPEDLVAIPGRSASLPNPFVLLAGPDASGVFARPITFYLANGHGDFHGGNILIPIGDHGPAAGEFRIIDYGRFSRRTPVARDPAKLMLDIAGTWLEQLPPHGPLRSRLAELVTWPEGHPESSAIVGYLAVAQAVHAATIKWYEDDSLQDWRPQHLVVQLGSALRFVADSELPMPTRWWYFEVAALAARGLADPAALTSAQAVTPLGRPDRTSSVDGSAAFHGHAAGNGSQTEVTSVLDEVARGIAKGWSGLADWVNTPEEVRQTFQPGREPFGLMAWLSRTGKIIHLRNSLIHIGRDDLITLLDADF